MTNEVNLGEEVSKIEDKNFISVYEYLTKNKDKIENASVLNFEKVGVPVGKYLVFKTNHITDAKIITLENPSKLWIKNEASEKIEIKNSGVTIHTSGSRTYITKNNVVDVLLENKSVTKINVYSKAKNKDKIKVTEVQSERQKFDVENVKLHIKKIAPRLYPKVKDISEKDEMISSINSYMSNIQDINNLVKIEEELNYTCSL